MWNEETKFATTDQKVRIIQVRAVKLNKKLEATLMYMEK